MKPNFSGSGRTLERLDVLRPERTRVATGLDRLDLPLTNCGDELLRAQARPSHGIDWGKKFRWRSHYDASSVMYFERP